MTTMTEADYKRDQAKKKKAAALKAKAKKKVVAKVKPKASKSGKRPMGSCAKVREIADSMPKAQPAQVYAKCEAAGVHPRTTRAEYANWCRDKYGKSPSERFGKSAKKKTTPKGKTTARPRAE